MSTDFLSGFSDLENKIEVLLQSLEEVKDENAILKQASDIGGTRVSELEGRVSELEDEKRGLADEAKNLKAKVDELTESLDEERGKVAAAAERVRGLLAKFSAVG